MSAARNRLRPTLLALVLGVVSLLLPASPANAGEFSLRQCEGSDQQGFSGAQTVLGGVDRVDFVAGCSRPGSGKLGVYQDRGGNALGFGVGGEFSWLMPPGARVIASRIDAKLKDANGILARPLGRRVGSDLIPLDQGLPHDGVQRVARWSGRDRSLEAVFLRLSCQATSCANAPASAKAYLEAFDVDLTIDDFRSPLVSPSGAAWEWAAGPDWHRGSAPITVEASDQGSGISRLWAEVNGLAVDLATVLCPGARSGFAVAVPVCPSATETTRSLDTSRSPFVDGANTLKVCVADYAAASGDANRTCSASRTVKVDNEPPGPPVELRSLGGQDWRAENRFELAWESPGGQVSPLVGGRYSVVAAETGETVESGEVEAADSGRLGPLAVPGPGAYELEVRLRDAAGNLGQPARTTVRFDDRPPGDVAPEPPAGWVSADELPLRQVIGRAEPGGPSGVGGYALAVSPSAPAAPCPTGICRPADLTVAGGAEQRTGLIPGLEEGSHWVSAVAASGAGVASAVPGSTVVKVDRTAPSVRLTGLPEGWSDRPVELRVEAADGGSGMASAPGDDGEPVTVIAAEGHAPYWVPGAAASFTVPNEGITRVRYWARDLAGNANDGERGPGADRHPPPGEAVVRIDTEPPRVAFLDDRDRRDPELVGVRAEDDGSGVGSVVVAWRRAGDRGGFTPLATARTGDRFEARMPSDDLPEGSYELRAEARDRAGNAGFGHQREDGSTMLLSLPLKERVRLSAGLGRRHRAGARVRFGAGAKLSGRITRGGGAGLAGAPLTVVETFLAGSKAKARATRIVADGAGRFALRLRPGPGRRVRVAYAGTRTLSRADSRGLAIGSRGRIRLRITPSRLRNGGWVTMRGRVARRGARLPARGKLVAIQYFDPSRLKWRPVEVLRADRRGRFRYRYRFRTIASAQRIVFRAAALAEAGWPYLASTSARRSVIVFPTGRSSR